MKKKIAVLLGGISAERNVSLKTGKYVSKSLKKQGYQVKEINVTANKKNLIKNLKVLTGGSTFINPPKKKAWKLIKDSGCTNMTIGGAKISDKHCNFLVNTGKANSNDLEILGNKIRSRVYKYSGTKLDWEIKIIGNR